MSEISAPTPVPMLASGESPAADVSGVSSGAPIVPVAIAPKPRRNRYRKRLTDVELRNQLKQFARDADPLNLLDEIALLRALVVQYINNYEGRVTAVLEWHRQSKRPIVNSKEEASLTRLIQNARKTQDDGQMRDADTCAHMLNLLIFQRDTMPVQVPDLTSDAAELIEAIGRMVERIEKARHANAISEAELTQMMHAMGRAVDLIVSSEAEKQRIRDAWLQLLTK